MTACCFSESRIKDEFVRALELSRQQPERQSALLRHVGYYGCVGDAAGEIDLDNACKYVRSARDADVIGEMYAQTLAYFAVHYRAPVHTTWVMATIDGGTVIHHPITDPAFVELGRVSAASDEHYVLRASLYDYDRETVSQWPLGSIYVRKRCFHCGSDSTPSLRTCPSCKDVFYCSSECRHASRPVHASYCLSSVLSQQLFS